MSGIFGKEAVEIWRAQVLLIAPVLLLRVLKQIAGGNGWDMVCTTSAFQLFPPPTLFRRQLGYAVWHTFRHGDANNSCISMSVIPNNLSSIYCPPSDDGQMANNVKSVHTEGDADSSTSSCAYYSVRTPARRSSTGGERVETIEVRKSCDYCVIRKKKCGGNGTRTCRLVHVKQRLSTTVSWYDY